MATEEIEISELELAEELAPDNLIPIENLTDTKATTLQKIKEWLGSFFVDKTSNEEIGGVKIFNSSPKVPTISGSSYDTTATNTKWVTDKINDVITSILNSKLVYDSGYLILSNNTNSTITLSNALSSSELHKYQVIVLLKPNNTIQNFTTDMYLNAQSGYFYEKNNSVPSTTGILIGLSTTQIRYKTGNNAVYYSENASYDWSHFKARFLIYKM